MWWVILDKLAKNCTINHLTAIVTLTTAHCVDIIIAIFK